MASMTIPVSDTMSSGPHENKSSTPSGPGSISSREGSPFEEALSQQVDVFFGTISTDGFPKSKSNLKTQPWKNIWEHQGPSPDGRLIVACPKKCVYGSNNLGGL